MEYDHCPRCGSDRVRIRYPETQRWYCDACERFFSDWTEDVTHPDTLGRYLCLLRGRKGLTIKDVSRLVGTSDAFITMVERGRRRPSLANLARWVQALGGDLGRARQFWDNWRKETPERKH